MKKRISPKLNRVLETLLFHNNHEFQFYFYVLNYVDFYEDENLPMPTMGVTVKDMRLALLYHPEFVEEHNELEIMAVLIHEVKHLLHNHISRGKHYAPEMANIAMDMIINHLIETYHKSVTLPRLTQEKIDKSIAKAKEAGTTIDQDMVKRVQKRVGASACVSLDPNYKGDLVFEPLYKWLKDNKDKEDKGEGNELSQETKDMLKGMPDGQTTDSHLPTDEQTEELKKQLGKDVFERVKVQLRGMGSNNVEESMNMLLKPPANNNLRLLKRVISAFKGKTKVDSYRRINRRILGLKGTKKISQTINVLLDVSGSMYGRFDTVLSEIFRDGYEINLIQVDTSVQKVEKIKSKSELKTLAIKGLGGTCLTPGIHYIIDPKNKLSRFPTVILSDGETDTLDFKYTTCQFLVLTVDKKCPITNHGANIREILIEGI